jgi:hypothetical protein
MIRTVARRFDVIKSLLWRARGLQMRNLPKRDAKSLPLQVRVAAPAPGVILRSTGASVSIEPDPDDAADGFDDWRARYLAAFGTANEAIAEALLQELLNGLLGSC